jgi:hypothetical protein
MVLGLYLLQSYAQVAYCNGITAEGIVMEEGHCKQRKGFADKDTKQCLSRGYASVPYESHFILLKACSPSLSGIYLSSPEMLSTFYLNPGTCRSKELHCL